MLAQIASLIMLTGGIPPEQMAPIVADRLARLDKLVVDVHVEQYKCPGSASPLDQTQWVGPWNPGDGAERRLTIVRPNVLDESYTGEDSPRIVTSLVGGRSVRRYGQLDPDGRTMYSVNENSYEATTYTSTPVLQVFDLQIYESFVPDLNILRLLRDYPAELVGSDNEVSTYAVSVEIDDWSPVWLQHYEFDLDSAGTPRRFKMTSEALDGSGFVFTCEMFTLATAEVNGAELVTEAVAVRQNTYPVDYYGIDHFVVACASVDEGLSGSDVRIEPEQRNARIWITHGDLRDEQHLYDEAGNLLASLQLRSRWRRAAGPAVIACAILGAVGIAFVSRRHTSGR